MIKRHAVLLTFYVKYFFKLPQHSCDLNLYLSIFYERLPKCLCYIGNHSTCPLFDCIESCNTIKDIMKDIVSHGTFIDYNNNKVPILILGNGLYICQLSHNGFLVYCTFGDHSTYILMIILCT